MSVHWQKYITIYDPRAMFSKTPWIITLLHSLFDANGEIAIRTHLSQEKPL